MSEPAFEVHRFAAEPAAEGVVVLDLEGRFINGIAADDHPRLVLEGPDGERECPAVVHGPAEEGRWRACFAAPADVVDAATAHGVVLSDVHLELPAPTRARGADRHVALAREANALRREVDRLRARVGGADEAVAEAAALRVALERTLDQLERAKGVAEQDLARRRALDADLAALRERLRRTESRASAAELRVAESEKRIRDAESRLAGTAEAAAATERSLEETRAELARAREAEAALRRTARRERAELESLRRELHAREDAPTHVPVRAPAPVAPPVEGDDEDVEEEATVPIRPRRRGSVVAEDTELEPGERVERVRVLAPDGRPKRLARDPVTATLPPVTGQPLEPPDTAIRWIALAAILTAAAIVIAFLLGM